MIGIYYSNKIINGDILGWKKHFLEFGPGNGILMKIIIHIFNQF